uniref:DNA-repair protein Xrcc1 N-terminal domain-containing protein n=1 Tax=Anas platyrhynchos platyrhynchos TaxID=8840 RepID=A0A493TS38_ANAPP
FGGGPGTGGGVSVTGGGSRYRGGPVTSPPPSQLAREQRIHSVHIGNDGAAFVEVLVGAAAGGDFQVLLPTAAFLTPGESRAGSGLQRVRLFGPDALVKAAAERPWDRVRIVCSQPYCQVTPKTPQKNPKHAWEPTKNTQGHQNAPGDPQTPHTTTPRTPRHPLGSPKTLHEHPGDPKKCLGTPKKHPGTPKSIWGSPKPPHN